MIPRMGKVIPRMKTQNGSAQGGTDGAAILSQMIRDLFRPAQEGRLCPWRTWFGPFPMPDHFSSALSCHCIDTRSADDNSNYLKR